MNSANRTTLLMLLIAGISAATAAYYYPWPEPITVDAEVGKPLFEEYSASKVRGIDVIEFDSDTGTMDRIKLARKGEKWVVPARRNFIVSNSSLVSAVVNALNDRNVFDVISENQQDHIKYGVVDPAEFSSELNVESLGRKLILSDRNNKSIASLIVGSALKDNPIQRHVRIPGKPRVYLVEFDERLLNTEFAAWVDPNLLQLNQGDGSGQQFRALTIENYRLVTSEDTDAAARQIYQATLQPAGKRLSVSDLRMPFPNDDQEPESVNWKKLSPTAEQSTLLNGSALSLYSLAVDDVRRKGKELAKLLKQPTIESGAGSKKKLSQLEQFGFRTSSNEDGPLFLAENGHLLVSTREGITTQILIGTTAGANSRLTGKLNHFVMLYSQVDEDSLPEPQRPPGVEDDESEENKQFRRKLKDWKKAVDDARRLADDMNAIHGDWLYLISEDTIARLMPEIPLPEFKPETPGKDDEANSAEEDSSEGQ